MVSGFDSSVATDNQVVTITVIDKTATFNVTIQDVKPAQFVEGSTSITVTNVDVNREDDVLTQPNGSYSVQFNIEGITGAKDLKSLKVELKKGDTVLATNTLQIDKAPNNKEGHSSYQPSPFNIGRTEVDARWAWERGTWNGDLTVIPTQATVTYETTDGIKYQGDIEAPSDLQAPTKVYTDDVVQVAQYIVATYPVGTTEIKDNEQLKGYVIEVVDNVATIKSSDEQQEVLAKVILRKEA